MKVALSQKRCTIGKISGNITDYPAIVKKAKSLQADLVVFPELSDTGYDLENIRSVASSYDDGLPLAELKKAASANEIAIIAGITEKTTSHIYNSAIVIDSRGEVITNYRKIHLYTPNGESVFAPGQEPVYFDFMGFRIGLNICYDLRFPEFARYLARLGVNILVVPTAWPFPRIEHWNLLTRARAIENQCYVLGANRVGSECGFTFCGNSRIVDPHGVIVASASEDQEELILGEVQKARIDFIRNRQPIFSHIRSDLFNR